MRLETPWHIRTATHEEQRRYERLTELHRLTTTWIREVQTERPSHFLDRGFGADIKEKLQVLSSLTDEGIGSLLDDTSPAHVLNRIEKTVWVVQILTLRTLLASSPQGSERAALRILLEQASWKCGRDLAERIWSELSESIRTDLRQLIPAITVSPFTDPSHGPGYLLIRTTQTEAEFEIFHCGRTAMTREGLLESDDTQVGSPTELCHLHAQWIKGFAYGLNPRIEVQAISCSGMEGSRCRQRWNLR